MTVKRAVPRLAHAAMGVALGVALPALPAAAATGRALSLNEAIAGALAKNDRIVIERESLVAAQAGIDGARGAYDPLLHADLFWEKATLPVDSAFSGAPDGEAAPTTRNGELSASLEKLLPTGATVTLRGSTSRETTDGMFTLLSPAYDSQLGVELRQPLLRDRAIDPARLRIRVAAAENDRAKASLGVEISNSIAAVETAYWTLAAAYQAIGVLEESVRLAEEQLAETQIRIDKGTAPGTEIAQPRAELERRKGDLLSAREATARADSALKRLILGEEMADWTEPLVPIDDVAIEVAPVDLEASIERALTSRAELSEQAAAIARRNAEADAANDVKKPALDAVVSYDRLGLSGTRNPSGSGPSGDPPIIPPDIEGGWGQALSLLGDGPFDDLRAGLSLSVPLGNRAARAAAAQALSAVHQAEAELSGVRKDIRAEVLNAAAGVDAAAQRVEAARAGREAATIQLNAERDRYAAGLSINFLVLTRQNDLSRAGLDEIAARAHYRRARTELARATGSILEERHIDVAAEPLNGGIPR